MLRRIAAVFALVFLLGASVATAQDNRTVYWQRWDVEINDVDTTVKTVIGSDDEHVHPRLHLGAVVEHISDRNHRLFSDEWDRTHEILQLAVQGSTFNANWEHESSTLNVEPGI